MQFCLDAGIELFFLIVLWIEDPKQGNSVDLSETFSQFIIWFVFNPHLKVSKMQGVSDISESGCQWSEQGQHVWWKCTIRHEPVFCCFFIGKEWTSMVAPWGARIWSRWVFMVYTCWQSRTKLADESICMFSMFSGQPASVQVLFRWQLSGHRGQNHSESRKQIEGSLLTS